MDICTVAEAKKRAPNDEPDIGDDIWIEILSRLHPKTLTRLKCTSKTWHRLASTAVLHSQIKTPISGFFIRRVRCSTRKESIRYHHLPTAAGQSSCTDHTLSFLPSHPYTTILDSRHGFLLCSSAPDDMRNNYYLCNPVTRQWVSLPQPRQRALGKTTYPYNCSGLFFLTATLVFDDPSHVSSDQYRIYRFVRFGLGSIIDVGSGDKEGEDEQEEENMNHKGYPYLCVDIYSSETGQWTQSKAPWKRHRRFFHLLNRPSVLLDGAMYMLGAPHLLLRFHVKEECFEFIDLPCDNLDMTAKQATAPNDAVWMFDECEPSKWVLKHGVELQLFGIILNPPFVAGERPPPQATLDILEFHSCLDAVLIRKVDGFYWYYTQSSELERILPCSTPFTMRSRDRQERKVNEGEGTWIVIGVTDIGIAVGRNTEGLLAVLIFGCPHWRIVIKAIFEVIVVGTLSLKSYNVKA